LLERERIGRDQRAVRGTAAAWKRARAFGALSTADSWPADWARLFHGRDGVASWNRTDNIGKQAHFDLVGIEETDVPDRLVATPWLAVLGFLAVSQTAHLIEHVALALGRRLGDFAGE